MKRVTLIYGDLCILHPRERYADLTVAHSVDGATFMSRLSVKPLQGGDLLLVCGRPSTNLYFIAALCISVTIYYGQRKKPLQVHSCLEVLLYINTLIFQQANRPPSYVVHRKVNLYLDKIWRFTLLLMASIFSALLVTRLASGARAGIVHRTDDIEQLLKENQEARILFGNNSIHVGVVMNNFESLSRRHVWCDHHGSACYDMFMNQTVSFFLDERHFLEYATQRYNMRESIYIMDENICTCQTTFGLPRGCFLKAAFNQVSETQVISCSL